MLIILKTKYLCRMILKYIYIYTQVMLLDIKAQVLSLPT